MSSQMLAHVESGVLGHFEPVHDQHSEKIFHATKYDGQVGPTAQFFLNYYPLIITFAGLLLFAALQFRRVQPKK